MPKIRTYPLCEDEQAIVDFLARMKSSRSRKAGVTNLKFGDHSIEYTERLGVGGEIAVAAIYNVYPRLTSIVKSCKFGTDPFDLTIYGRSVDVKTTPYPNGRLTADITKTRGKLPDFFALVTAAWPEFSLIGFLPSRELIKPARLQNLGHGPCYVARQDELLEDPI